MQQQKIGNDLMSIIGNWLNKIMFHPLMEYYRAIKINILVNLLNEMIAQIQYATKSRYKGVS